MSRLVRQAGPADAAELLRLRRVMFAAMHGDAEPGEWEARGVQLARGQLAEEQPRLGAFVIDAPAGAGLAACAVGQWEQRLPAPGHPLGRFGFVYSVCTDEAYRHRGYARATTEALLAWFAQHGATRVDLHATADAEALYRSLGFAEHSTALSLHLPPQPAGQTARGGRREATELSAAPER